MGRPLWNVPYPRNPAFTGCKDILSILRKRFTKRVRTALVQAISGLGGIGKTQTAVEYAYRYRDKYAAVLWLNAESDLKLKAGCRDVGCRMNLPQLGDDLDQAVQALKHWLETQTGWLLILDNADDPARLKSVLPTEGYGHILITSRASDFQVLGILESVELSKLPIKDSTEFLLRRCRCHKIENQGTRCCRVAHELDSLPLALEQAAAYILERKASFRGTDQGMSAVLDHLESATFAVFFSVSISRRLRKNGLLLCVLPRARCCSESASWS